MSKTFSFGGIIAVGIIAIAAWQIHTQLAYAKSVGTIITEQNTDLQEHINIFMAAEGTEADFWFDGRENYHCSSILYGYDDQYAYTWSFCAGYVGNSPDVLRMGIARSGPVRFTYAQPNFVVTAVKETGDGNLYESSLRKMFPKTMYTLASQGPSNEVIATLEDEVVREAELQITDTSSATGISLKGNEYTVATADLDGNGTEDSIALMRGTPETQNSPGTPTTLNVNGTVVEVPGRNPQGYFGIVDIDTSDHIKEIAVGDLGPSTDYTTSFYAFDGNSLQFMGTTEGLYERMEFDGKGGFITQTRATMLDTWFYVDRFTLSKNHTLAHVPQDFYERVSKLGGPMLAPLSFQASPTDPTISMTLAENEAETIVGCDNVRWCKVESNDGREGWFSIDDNGFVDGTSLFPHEVFDGLSFAD